MTPVFAARRPAGSLSLAGAFGILLVLTGAYVPGEPEPRPNILINPSMELDQANEGNSVSLSSGANAFVVDGWSAGFHSASATVSAQRVTDAPAGFANSVKLTVGAGATVAAGDYLFIRQPIEANELTNLALGTGSARQICVSFWAKSSVGSYTLSAALQNYAGTRGYPLNFTVASANTWTPLSACFTADTGGTWITSGTAGGAYLIVAAAVGSTFQGTVNTWAAANLYGTTSNTNTVLSTSGATFQVGGVKLEAAPGPTPFARRPIAEEIHLAQRYYEKTYDIGTAPGAVVASFAGGENTWSPSGTGGTWYANPRFKVRKRIAPAVTIYSPATGASGKYRDVSSGSDFSASAARIGQGGFEVDDSGHVSANDGVVFFWVADARLNP